MNVDRSGAPIPGAERSALQIRHLILFVLCLMYFIAYIDRVNISVAGPALRKENIMSFCVTGVTAVRVAA